MKEQFNQSDYEIQFQHSCRWMRSCANDDCFSSLAAMKRHAALLSVEGSSKYRVKRIGNPVPEKKYELLCKDRLIPGDTWGESAHSPWGGGTKAELLKVAKHARQHLGDRFFYRVFLKR